MKQLLLGALLALSLPVLAGAPQLQQPLPTLSVSEQGEMVLDGDSVKYQAWESKGVGKVQVLQYIPATTNGSKIFVARSTAPAIKCLAAVLYRVLVSRRKQASAVKIPRIVQNSIGGYGILSIVQQ